MQRKKMRNVSLGVYIDEKGETFHSCEDCEALAEQTSSPSQIPSLSVFANAAKQEVKEDIQKQSISSISDLPAAPGGPR